MEHQDPEQDRAGQPSQDPAKHPCVWIAGVIGAQCGKECGAQHEALQGNVKDSRPVPEAAANGRQDKGHGQTQGRCHGYGSQ